MAKKLYRVSGYLHADEYRTFQRQMKSWGMGKMSPSESAYVRFALGFEPLLRGAPEGHERGGRQGKKRRAVKRIPVPSEE